MSDSFTKLLQIANQLSIDLETVENSLCSNKASQKIFRAYLEEMKVLNAKYWAKIAEIDETSKQKMIKALEKDDAFQNLLAFDRIKVVDVKH